MSKLDNIEVVTIREDFFVANVNLDGETIGQVQQVEDDWVATHYPPLPEDGRTIGGFDDFDKAVEAVEVEQIEKVGA